MGILRINIEELTEGHRQVADFIEKNQNRISYLTVEEIAEELGMSIATISRFAQVAGYTNFKELKADLRNAAAISPSDKVHGKLAKVTSEDMLSGLIQSEIENLEKTDASLDRNDFNRAVDALADVEKVCIFGSGPSHSLAELLSFRLNRFGYSIHELGRNASSMAEALLHLDKNSVIVAFAFFKERALLEKVFYLAKERGATSILITDMMVSKTGNAADIILYTCRGEMWEFHSMVAPVALIDSLVLSLATVNEKKNLTKLKTLQETKDYLRKG